MPKINAEEWIQNHVDSLGKPSSETPEHIDDPVEELIQGLKLNEEFLFIDDSIEAMEEITDEDLEHFGVLGMKWGVRKSKTERNLERRLARREKRVSKSKASGAEKTESKRKRRSAKQQDKADSKQSIRKGNKKQDKVRKAAKKNVRNATNEEITSLTKRLESEKKLKNLIDEDVAPGRKFLNSVTADAGKKIATTWMAGGTLYMTKAALDGKFDVGDLGKALATGKVK